MASSGDSQKIMVGVRQLRSKLRHYLDLVEQGHDVLVIRNSVVIGRLVPTDRTKAFLEEKQDEVGRAVKLADNKEVLFRKFGVYEDPGPVQALHEEALRATGAYVEGGDDSDLWGPAGSYEAFGGEFWVGEINGEIIAMGAFKANLGSGVAEQAELKRMRVKPSYQGLGLGSQIIKILEEQARKQGYKSMVLDVTDAPGQAQARQFYSKHGYQETHREPRGQFVQIYYFKEL